MDMVNRLIQIAKGISLSLGETCEAVVHDGDHRIAYIANGHISGREQGQEMEESVFKYFEDETRANNGTVVRLTRKNNGELHKSTTMMFFDENGAYEAMLCFTVNLTALDQAKKMLDSLMNVMPFESPEAMGSDLTIADYCVTLTLSQLPGISVVRITVEGQDLAYRTHSLLQSREVLMTSEDDVTRTLGVRLFFPARESGLLTSESRTLTLHEGDSAVEAIMSALMEGPQTESLSPLLPEGFQMLTVRVESGTCYLNLPRLDVSLLPEGLEAQQLLVRGLVNSLCSANGVDRVQLLLDGQVAASFGQVDISGPLYRE